MEIREDLGLIVAPFVSPRQFRTHWRGIVDCLEDGYWALQGGDQILGARMAVKAWELYEVWRSQTGQEAIIGTDTLELALRALVARYRQGR